MRVRLEDDYRELYTVAQYDNAKTLIEVMKGYDESPFGLAEEAVNLLMDRYRFRERLRVMCAEAYTMRNNTIESDRVDTGTGKMDVCIEFVAITYSNVVHAYISMCDIWEGKLNDCNSYIELYKRV